MAGNKAVLLVGGLGTRLRPLTYLAPKPMMPVANRPLVWYSLRMLARGGVDQAVLASGYMHEMLASTFAEPDPDLPHVTVAVEDTPLDTAGAVRNSLQVANGPFVVMNGDQIMDVEVAALLRSHVERRADVTIVVRRVADVSAYGLLQVSADGCIEAFLEKCPDDPTGRNLVNSGMYVLSPSVLEAIPSGVPYSNETQLFPSLIAAGKRLVGFEMHRDAYWADVGTPGKYLDANRRILRRALPWVSPFGTSSDLRRAERVTLREPLCVGSGCSFGTAAEIGPDASIGGGVTVGRGASLSNCIVWPAAVVGEDCKLENVIVGPGRRVPPGTVMTGPEPRILAPDVGEMTDDE